MYKQLVASTFLFFVGEGGGGVRDKICPQLDACFN